jgi:hypothetical protein
VISISVGTAGCDLVRRTASARSGVEAGARARAGRVVREHLEVELVRRTTSTRSRIVARARVGRGIRGHFEIDLIRETASVGGGVEARARGVRVVGRHSGLEC